MGSRDFSMYSGSTAGIGAPRDSVKANVLVNRGMGGSMLVWGRVYSI